MISDHITRIITNRMRQAINGLELTDKEKRTLDYLCEYEEYRTVNNLISIIEKARKSTPNA